MFIASTLLNVIEYGSFTKDLTIPFWLYGVDTVTCLSFIISSTNKFVFKFVSVIYWFTIEPVQKELPSVVNKYDVGSVKLFKFCSSCGIWGVPVTIPVCVTGNTIFEKIGFTISFIVTSGLL